MKARGSKVVPRIAPVSTSRGKPSNSGSPLSIVVPKKRQCQSFNSWMLLPLCSGIHFLSANYYNLSCWKQYMRLSSHILTENVAPESWKLPDFWKNETSKCCRRYGKVTWAKHEDSTHVSQLWLVGHLKSTSSKVDTGESQASRLRHQEPWPGCKRTKNGGEKTRRIIVGFGHYHRGLLESLQIHMHEGIYKPESLVQNRSEILGNCLIHPDTSFLWPAPQNLFVTTFGAWIQAQCLSEVECFRFLEGIGHFNFEGGVFYGILVANQTYPNILRRLAFLFAWPRHLM